MTTSDETPTAGGAAVPDPTAQSRLELQRASRWVHRELVLLLVLVGVTVAAFALTRAAAESNRQVRRGEAASWFAAARGHLDAGRTAPAVEALRRASAKDPRNGRYRLALASALASNGQEAEAERLLLSVREAEPEDPETNLQLARLAARGADVDEAGRHYQSTLAALWRPEDAEARRSLRVELIEFLLDHGDQARALSELLMLGAMQPGDEPAADVQLGGLFRRAGDPRRALDYFERALADDMTRGEALAGAGEAAFEIGDYLRARRYLSAAPAGDARVMELKTVADLVLTRDPLAPRLSAAERRRRLLANLEDAGARARSCLAGPAAGGSAVQPLEMMLVEAAALERATTRRATAADTIEDGVALVYRLEQSAEAACGASASPVDRALGIIGQRHNAGDG